MKAHEPTGRRAAGEALQRGAARGLAAVLHARHPHLSFEITVGPSERDRWPSRAALDAEARRLKAVGNQSHAVSDGAPAPSNPNHRKSAAKNLATLRDGKVGPEVSKRAR